MMKIQGCKNEKHDNNLRNENTMDFYEPISHMCISINLVKFTWLTNEQNKYSIRVNTCVF